MAGRPPVEFDWDQFQKLCMLPPVITNQDIAWIMECSIDTCQDRINQRFPDLTFSQYREQMGGRFRSMLLSKQLQVAMKGNAVMLLWLGKQYLGQTDSRSPQPTGKSESKLVINFGSAANGEESSE